ncbi:MAG: hypothetical protein WBP12_02175 [Candidatus Saccharimonas sp.]
MTVNEAWRMIESWERYGCWFNPTGADTPERLQRAESIAPVAKAIAELSYSDDGLVTDITEGDRQPRMASGWGGGPALGKFLVYNNYPAGYGLIGTRPSHGDVWGPLADLGLVAVVVEARITYNGPRSIVTLVLPAWHRGNNSDVRTLNLLQVASDGLYEIKSCALYSWDDTRGRIGKPLALLPTMDYFLGIKTPVDRPWPEMTVSSDLRLLGFPGAHEYLQTNLPNLGEYLSGLVAMNAEAAARQK